MNKIKIFTFKYDPNISLERMGQEIQKVVKTGQSNLSLHQISFANIEDITGEFISPRPKLFACLVEKKPKSLYQLAKLLKRDYANVYKDVKSLVTMGIIKLEKEGERSMPIPLYDQIVFDFGKWQKKKLLGNILRISPFNFLEKMKIWQKTKEKFGIEYKIYDNNK
jgi:predicted transcriptional regulator